MRNRLAYSLRILIALALIGLLRATDEALASFAVTIYLTIATIVVWRRTRLPLMTVGGTLGALYFVMAHGILHYTGSSSAVGMFGVAMIIAIVLLITVERQWHPVAMKEWDRAIQNGSLCDILVLNDIPCLVNRAEVEKPSELFSNDKQTEKGTQTDKGTSSLISGDEEKRER